MVQDRAIFTMTDQ